jgi:predicted nucleotide-binding protein
MNKREAIEFLKKKVSEIPHLKELTYSNQGVIKWRNSIEDVLEAIFGRDSTEFKRFYHTRIDDKKWNSTNYKQRLYVAQLRNRQTALLTIIQKYEILGIPEESRTNLEKAKTSEPPKAFIAHGGRSGILDKLRDFLQACGIDPLIVEFLPTKGMSVDDKVKKYIQDADCGIVLATRGGIIDGKSEKQHPRLNVIDEFERLRAVFPDKTILLLEKGVDLPSNIAGLTYEPFVGQSMDRAFTAIARELKEMGILQTIKPPKGVHLS